jgi:hypothetical protein
LSDSEVKEAMQPEQPLSKVMICHNGNSIWVALASLPAHLRHGDKLGPCPVQCTQQSVTNNYKTAPADALHKVSVFPNPVHDNLNIRLSGFAGPFIIKLYDATGTLLLSQRMTSNPGIISLKNLSSGVYHLQIGNGSKTFVEKIIKQ